MHYQFRISVSSIALIVPEVCQAVYNALKDECLHFPENEEEWLSIAVGFENVWQLPHCLGAADGKHVCPRAMGQSAVRALALGEGNNSAQLFAPG